MSKNTKEILKQIDQAEQTIAMEQQLTEPSMAKTKAAWETAIAQAKAQVKTLKEEYVAALLGNGVAIFVVGPAAQSLKFAELAQEEGGTLTLDAAALYARLAEPVDAALGRERQFLPTHVGLIHQVLKEVGTELGMRSIVAFRYSEAAFLPTKQHVVEHVRKLVRATIGDELNELYIKHALGAVAAKERYTGNVVPVVVVGAEPDEIPALGNLFATVGTVEQVHGDQEVDLKYVTGVFQNVMKVLKGKKKSA